MANKVGDRLSSPTLVNCCLLHCPFFFELCPMKSSTTLLATLILLGVAAIETPAKQTVAVLQGLQSSESRLTLGTLDGGAQPARFTLLAQSSTPTTYITRSGPDTIIVQITDGNFFFRDEMHRSYGNAYQATDYGVRVNFDADSGRVVIISDETGEEFYNYFFTGTIGAPNSASNSAGSSYDDYTTGPPSINNIVRLSDDEYSVDMSDGQFYFEGLLYRTSGETFVGSDGRFRVMYDRSSGRVVVINLYNGVEIFNYFYSDVDEGYL